MHRQPSIKPVVQRLRLPFLFLIFVFLNSSIREPSSLQTRANPSADNSQFSHRVHLALSTVTCMTCHARASESTKVSDNNIPPPTDCLRCHDGQKSSNLVVQQKALSSPRPNRKLFFNHKLHLSFGNVAPAIAAAIDSNQYLGPAKGLRNSLDTEDDCEACHRGLGASDATLSSNYPPMADCLVCHATIEPPFSCGFCHPDDAQLKPASHTSDFMDRHSSQIGSLDRSTCKVCHGVRFRCKGCH